MSRVMMRTNTGEFSTTIITVYDRKAAWFKDEGRIHLAQD